MFMTFDKSMTNGWSTWALTDDRITVTEKVNIFKKKTTVVFLEDITKLAHIEDGGEINVISIHYKKPGAYDGHLSIAYQKFVKNKAEKAMAHIFAVSRCKDGTEEQKKMEKDLFGDHRKRCKVCGHIFCYTYADKQKNHKLQNEADNLRKMGELEWWGTSMAAGNLDKQRAEALEAQIVDYSKCPKCGSRELVEVTDEELASTESTQQSSSADELKKFKELLDMGVITQEEFDAKKKQLLGL